VAENIAYGLKVQKRPAHEITERTNTLLTDFGIAALMNRYPGSLSGGEQQRVALARALATKPSVLLLDEPFASLDPRTRDDCIRVMQELKDRRSITIVQVSHSCDEAYALADRVVVLLEGRIAQAGNPDEIFRSPVSTGVAQFVGMENVLAGTIINNGSGRSWLAVRDGTIPLSAEYPSGARITIGIPADSVRIFSVEPAFGEPGMVIIPCHITRVTSGKDAISFRLEGAIPLNSVMRRTCDSMEIPHQGMEVFAVFTNTDIRILSGD
jgi:ABC-type sulfate/molybdate transport systems ATPase subunit